MTAIKLGIGLVFIFLLTILLMGIFIEPERNTTNPSLLNCSPLGVLKDFNERWKETSHDKFRPRWPVHRVQGVRYARYMGIWYLDCEPKDFFKNFPNQSQMPPRYCIVYADGSTSIERELAGEIRLGRPPERNLDHWVEKYVKQGGELFHE